MDKLSRLSFSLEAKDPNHPDLEGLYEREDQMSEACAPLNEGARRQKYKEPITFNLWWQMESSKIACREAAEKAARDTERVVEDDPKLTESFPDIPYLDGD